MIRTIFLLSAVLVLATFAVQCNYNGKLLNNNEVTISKNAFRVKCFTEPNGSWRTEIIGCVTPDGAQIDVGQKKKSGNKELECVKTKEGSVSLKESMQIVMDPKGYNCKAKDGSMKKHGDQWVEGNFVRKCADYGQGQIIGCHHKDVRGTIPLNDSVKVGDTTHECKKDGANYGFRSYSKKG